MQASDGLYQVTQQYPARAISRTYWKTFNDGVFCPYSAQGHGGDVNSCDYYFDSPNGCRAHGMDNYFGGHPAEPQSVFIKDNSTGTWGIGRNTVTATSTISDTIWGNALGMLVSRTPKLPLHNRCANARWPKAARLQGRWATRHH